MTSTHVEVGERSDQIIAEIERAVIGKRNVLEMILLGLLADGHVLIDDVPGLAKTLMARSFASVLGLGFGRVQFTPDLVPSDITGATIYDQHRGTFEFRRGPVFDEHPAGGRDNRAPAKTQAALLEATEERRGHDRGRGLISGCCCSWCWRRRIRSSSREPIPSRWPLARSLPDADRCR